MRRDGCLGLVFCTVVAAFAGWSADESAVRAFPFQNGERVVFLGDSITHHSYWINALTDYYLTRFPDRKIAFRNAGLSGDTVSAALGRVDEDVVPWKPTSVAVMFGMNDAGLADYATNASPAMLSKQAASLAAFETNLVMLVQKLEASCPSARRIWLSTTPYDETVTGKHPGGAAGVSACAQEMLRLAKQKNEVGIDMNGPLTALNTLHQRENSAFSLCGSDGVHPREAGGLVIAAQVLAAQGVVPPDPVVLDASSGNRMFTVVERSLPCPIEPAARAIADEIGFVGRLASEKVVVTGLSSGVWRLSVDGERVLEADASEFAAGVELGDRETPMMRQAREVVAANRVIREQEKERQYVSVVRQCVLKPNLGSRVDNDEAVWNFVREKGSDPMVKANYFSKYLDLYLKNWPRRKALAAEIVRREAELDLLRQPRSHVWTLQPVTAHDITAFGAVADGRTKCTAAFEKAVAACAAAGGGRVMVPPGHFFTGPVHLKDNVELFLSKGAVVEFSDDPQDALPAVYSSWEGLECLNYSPFVYAFGCTNVAITGSGTLRAKMDRWRVQMKQETRNWTSPVKDPHFDIQAARAILYKWGSEDYPVEKRDMPKAHPAIMRPQLVQFNRCRGVRIEGVRIEDSPFWTIHLFLCKDVVIRGIDVCAHGFNNDGVDIEMTQDVLIEDSCFDQGDDCFVFKAGRNRDAWRIGVPTMNVEIRNCRVKKAGSLLGVGSELSGGIENVHVHDCDVETVGRLYYIKTNHRRGGFVRNVRLENVSTRRVVKVAALETDVLYQWAIFPDYETKITEIDGMILRNVSCGAAKMAIDFVGDSRLPAKNLLLDNVHIGKTEKFFSHIEDVENVSMKNVTGSGIGSVRTAWDN